MEPENDTQGSADELKLSRRRALRVGAGGTTILLAGCASGGDGGDGDANQTGGDNQTDGGNETDGSDGSGGQGQLLDPTYDSFASWLPKEAQFNPYHGKNYLIQGRLVHWAPLMKYHVGSDTWIPMILSDWSMDGTSVTVTVTDQFTWHDGDPVTAEDVGTRFTLDYHMGMTIADYLSEPPTVGDGQVELALSDPVNPDVFWPLLNGNSEYSLLSTPASIYGKYAQQFEDASTEDEREAVQKDLVDFALKDPEKVLGNGPFQYTGFSGSKQQFERFDDYPVEYVQQSVSDAIGYDFSDWPAEINFPKWTFTKVKDLWPAYKTNKLDGGADNSSKEVYSQYPDHYRSFGVPRFSGWGITFQYDDDLFGDPKVRQAIAHVVDNSKPVPTQYFAFGLKVDHLTGMTTKMTEQWVSEEVRDSLTDYLGSNPEAATALLEEAGFTKEGGKWMTPGGSRFRIPIKSPSYSDIVSGTQVVTGQLEQFGIKPEFSAMENSSFYGQTVPNGKFRAIAASWGGGPHPFFAFRDTFVTQQGTNVPETVTVPPVGEPDADPSLEVDVTQEINNLGAATDSQRTQELVDKLAWTINQNVPIVPVAQKAHHYLVSTDEWEMPPVEHDRPSGHDPMMMAHSPCFWPVHAGAHRAKTE